MHHRPDKEQMGPETIHQLRMGGRGGGAGKEQDRTHGEARGSILNSEKGLTLAGKYQTGLESCTSNVAKHANHVLGIGIR